MSPEKFDMGIFSIPDIIIAMTLIVNAIALVSSSIRNVNETDIEMGKENDRINFDKGRMCHNEIHRNVDISDHVDSDVLSIQNNSHNMASSSQNDENKNSFRDQTSSMSADDSGGLISSSSSLLPTHTSTISESKVTTHSVILVNNNTTNNLNTNTSTIGSSILRFNKLMNAIRRLSCLIVVWNIFFTFLMVFVFGD